MDSESEIDGDFGVVGASRALQRNKAQPNSILRGNFIQQDLGEQASEAMAGNEAVTHTDSEKTSSCKFVKKTAVQLTIKFKIEEFEALMNSTEPGNGKLCSEGVSSDLVPGAIWVLEKDDKETLYATCHIYLVDGSGASRVNVEGRRTGNFAKSTHWGQHVSHDEVKKALHDDGSLLVAADVEFLIPCDLQQWPTKISKLYDDEASSDCSIEIGGETIPAHKFPLMACSPVFKEMFTNPATEQSKSGVIEITDFQLAEPMRALIRYCYQGFLDDATMEGDGAVEIFELASKYLIDDLKAYMEQHFIRKTLSVGNVIQMAVLADAHSAKNLMEACTKLIAREADNLFESADWRELKKARPELAIDLAVAACRKK